MKVIYHCLALIGRLLREIGDENAYQRHLSARGVAHSPDEWRRFLDGRLRRKYSQGRCC